MLIMVSKVRPRQLRLGALAISIALNISVFCIWIPARLQVNETYVRINNVWDRLEKAIFAIVDAGLNFYFMYTVRTKLVAGGLSKYTDLYKYNRVMVFLSIAMDVCNGPPLFLLHVQILTKLCQLVLIGSMSIGTGLM